ncbi:MAG TPA: RHS repeat-associated core domain-containing protein [Gemmatimonadales bacterium]
MADSAGELQGTVTGPEYDAGLWNSSGLTAHSHSFNPARWGVSGGIDTISTFRNRQYDPSTGKWLQEDPIGTAGGVNLYQYNGNDPNSFSDPFGLCHDENGKPRSCTVSISAYGKAHGASIDALMPVVRADLQTLADAADADLGINATTNGDHSDPGHAAGTAVDIGFINGRSIGQGSTTFPGMKAQALHVQQTAAQLGGLKLSTGNLGPAGKFVGSKGPFSMNPGTTAAHRNHIHLSYDIP